MAWLASCGEPDDEPVEPVDPDLEDWPEAYYGESYERLRQVKEADDPDGVFDFAQGVS